MRPTVRTIALVFLVGVVDAARGAPDACCLPDGSCLDGSPSACAAAGGETQGAGSNCATVSCVIYVDQAAVSGANNGANWADAYLSLSDALNSAVSGVARGRQVWVAEGTYVPDSTGLSDPRDATFDLPDGVGVFGGFPGAGRLPSSGDRDELTDRHPVAYRTTLSGDLNGDDHLSTPAGVFCYSGPGNAARPGCAGFDTDFDSDVDLSDLVTALGIGENCYHVVSASLVSDCVIDGFSIGGGNALLTEGGSCSSTFNGQGAGMYLGQDVELLVKDCVFIGNIADDGGGMYAHGQPTIRESVFTRNTARCVGGGVYGIKPNLVFLDTQFLNNQSLLSGGAMKLAGCTALVANTRFLGNESGNGGGVHADTCDTELINCVFSGNRGQDEAGGMEAFGGTTIIKNCTFSRNRSATYSVGGLDCHSETSCTVSNSILHGNIGSGPPPGVDEVHELYVPSASTDVTYSCCFNVSGSSYTGTGNITQPPGFVDSDGDDDVVGTWDDNVRLLLSLGGTSSPCIDAGSNSDVPSDLADLDDDGDTMESTPVDLDRLLRIADGDLDAVATVDMGAYELVAATANVTGGGTVTLNPGDVACDPSTVGDCNPTQDPLVEFENTSGTAGDVSAVEVGEPTHAVGGEFTAFGTTLVVETTLTDGDFVMTVAVPFEASDLPPGVSYSDVDLLWYDEAASLWKVAVCGNSSPPSSYCPPNPTGDRYVETVPTDSEPTLDALHARGLGKYGVFWDMVSGAGFVWANVDHATDFSAAYGEPVAADIPAVSHWGLVVMSLSVLVAGTLSVRRAWHLHSA